LPDLNAAELDLEELFGRAAPLEVDLGCGDGSFLRALAAEHPDRNFLGIERLLHRVRSSHRKAVDLPNVRVIRSETLFVLRHILPAGSVDAFYLLFPDPWPKRRHHRRRLVNAEFFSAIWNCLRNQGSLFIATDHDDYFAAIGKLLQNTPQFAPTDRDWALPPTTFEKRFRMVGLPIHRLELRKISPVT